MDWRRWFGRRPAAADEATTKQQQHDQLAERLAERLALRKEDRDRRLEMLRAMADLMREQAPEDTGERRND